MNLRGPHGPDNEARQVGVHLQDVLERVSDGLIALDRNWRYTYVNHQAASLFGRRPAELIGRHIWTEFPEGVGQPFHLAYEKAMAEQVFMEMENYYEPWDRWFENRIYPSPDGVSIFFHEITRRKQAEAVARESGELLKLQNQVLGLIVDGTELGETLDVLLRGVQARAPGLTASVLLMDADGIHIRHGAAPDLPADYLRAIDGQTIGPAAGSCGTAAFRREPVIVEDIATDPLWNDYRAVALAHGMRACWSTPIVDGRCCVLGTFALYFAEPGLPSPRHRQLIDMSTDLAAIAITKHREAEALSANEEQMRRRDAQLVAAQRIAQLGSYEWIVAENRVYRSEELCRIFGVDSAAFEATFEGYLRRVHPDDRDATRRVVDAAFTNGTPFSFEERIVRPDGSVRLLHSQGSWQLDEGHRPVRLVGICQDITERRQAEEQARLAESLRVKNDELKTFAYTVSHDLKAPLRGIAGYARELERHNRAALDRRGQHCVDQILVAAGTLDRLIEDLLHYSRLEAETPTAVLVNLPTMVETMLAARRPALLEGNVQVSISLAATTVRTWDRGLSQVLANVLDNAVKYSKDSTPPRVSITSEVSPVGVRLTIADNGIGFDIKYHDRIFGLFNRLVRQEHYEGTGAGLAIAKRVMDKLGGQLHATASPGAGATFFIDIPMAAPAAEE
jgi:PAS domain S-box-containing protein